MTMNRFLAGFVFGLIVLALIFALVWALGLSDTRIVSALLLLLVAVTLVWLEVHDRLGRQVRRKRTGPSPLAQPVLIRARPSVPSTLSADPGPLADIDVAGPPDHRTNSMCDPCSPVAQDSSTPECRPPGNSESL